MPCVKPVHSGVNPASRSNVTRQGFEAEAERNAPSKRDRKGSTLAQTLFLLSLGRTSSSLQKKGGSEPMCPVRCVAYVSGGSFSPARDIRNC